MEKTLDPWEVEFPYTVNCGWDFCPLLPDLLVVGTWNGDSCVWLEVPAIQSLLTVRTGSFTVHFADVRGGKRYRKDLNAQNVCDP